jgi:phosphatidate cytidylyltransferase
MKKNHSLGLRIVTGFSILALFLALIWIPKVDSLFAWVVALFVCIGVHEYNEIVRKVELGFAPKLTIAVGGATALSGLFNSIGIVCFALYAGCVALAAFHLTRERRAPGGIVASAFGVAYIGWAGAHMTLLHETSGSGPALVTILIAAVGLTDVGAFFAGVSFGKHKLAPVLSPNKTWEGAVGGFVATVVGMSIFYAIFRAFPIFHGPDWPLIAYLIVGAVLSVLGQIGDLFESALKRSSGVKDSGSIFPGHGGVLDRCDGYLFAAPVLYYIVTLFYRA